VNDVESLCRRARELGVLTVVDGAQAVPHQPVNVAAIGCDFYAFSSHKLCGPTGMGVLYGQRALLEKMEPYQSGGDMIREVSFDQSTWNDLPMKFEAGTPHIAGAVGLTAAIHYLQNIGMENIERHEHELLVYGLEKLQQIDGIRIFHPGEKNGTGILSFAIPRIHPHDLASLLNDEAICVRAGHHCAQPLMGCLNVPATTRASFYLYNTGDDVDRLAEALADAQKVLSR
jgi:cysteine desulfurase/selenocysteine lyase